MTGPIFMCVKCAKMPVADRPANTDGIIMIDGNLLCVTHRDLHQNADQKGGTPGGGGSGAR